MSISVFDLFTIGIGPSSSHTVGPMRAARRFVTALADAGDLARVQRVKIELFGSLAYTGLGHGTDRAVQVGLEGADPTTVDPDSIIPRTRGVQDTGRITLLERHEIAFDAAEDVTFDKRTRLPLHSNGMRFTAFGTRDESVRQGTYYSVGGGFLIDEAEGENVLAEDPTPLPFPVRSGDELLRIGREHGLSLSEIMMRNECTWRTPRDVHDGLLHIWEVMRHCVRTGCGRKTSHLPGSLRVLRRAPAMFATLTASAEGEDPLDRLDWVNLWALAVNEENASGGRVVTAPTNGAAGIIPAVLHFYERFVPGANDEGIVRFLLTAGAIGMLYKENASISGAEAGCQGEVGVACSMAAAGLVEARGGNMEQVEQAAEIGMEHNLGLTCDPVGGLVQIPCIERNAMGAVKAINAARLARHGDGTHLVSLDKVIRTMHQTGRDMKTKYKETSRGGLAVNVVEC